MGRRGRGKERKEKPLQPRRGAAAVPYPDGTVVDHQLDVPKRAGLILGEHGARHRAGRAQQQAALVPRDQRAPPQVSADEPRRPVVPVERVPLVPQRHDVDGPARTERGEGEKRSTVSAGPLGTGSAGTARPGWAPAPVPGRTARAGDRQWQDGGAYVHDLSSKGRAATRGEAAAHGLAGPPGGESTRNPLIPGRVPLARLHRGGADRAGPGRASQRASRTPGRVAGGGELLPLRERPGTSPGAGPPRSPQWTQLPAVPAPPRRLGWQLPPPAAAAAPPLGGDGGQGDRGLRPLSADRALHVPAPGVGRTRGTRSPPRPRSSRGGGRTQRSGPRGAPRNLN